MACSLQHVQAQPLGRADLRGLQQNDHDDPEPQQVHLGGPQHRGYDRQRGQHHGVRFHERAQQQVEHHQEQHQLHRGQVEAGHPLRHGDGDPQVREGELQRERRHENEQDHRRRARRRTARLQRHRAHEPAVVPQTLAVEPVLLAPALQRSPHLRRQPAANAAPQQQPRDVAREQPDEVVDDRQRHRSRHAEPCRLRRRRPPEVDAAQHDENQRHHRDHQHGEQEPLRPALPGPEPSLLLPGRDGRPDHRRDADHQHEHQRQQYPRDEPRQEQPPDGLAHRQPVQHQQDARRNQDAQSPAGRQRSHHQPLLVTLRPERGQRDPAHRRRRGDAGAGAGGEHRARGDVGVHQPARDEVHPTGQGPVHQVGEPAPQHDLPHQDEQRDCHQVDVGVGLPRPVAHDVPDGVVGEQAEQDQRQRSQRPGHIHAGQEHDPHQDECDGDEHGSVGFLSAQGFRRTQKPRRATVITDLARSRR